MPRSIPTSLLVFGFIVQILSILLSSPYTPWEFGVKQQGSFDDHSNSANAPASRGKLRALFLTAHPDDESMFFAPTLLGLINPSPSAREMPTSRIIDDNPVVNTAEKLTNFPLPESLTQRTEYETYSLCLSPGGKGELAERRKRELQGSLTLLGVEKERRWLLDLPFEDNITQFWDVDLIVKHVKPFVTKNEIDVIFTFDEQGISSHPNHISLARGASRLLSEINAAAAGPSLWKTPTRPIRVFTLRTRNQLTKYSGAFGALVTRFHVSSCIMHRFIASPDSTTAQRISEALRCDEKQFATFILNFRGYLSALTAMLNHRSQMVWFRWLYVSWSRYMWVNEWIEILD